jgi:hypothetical protein
MESESTRTDANSHTRRRCPDYFPQDGGYNQIILVQDFVRVREQTLGKANMDLQNLKEGRNWQNFR